MRLTRGALAVGAVALLVTVVCIRLGFWQLDRLEQRRTRNAAMRAALALPPIPLHGDSLALVARDPERFLFRRALARGEYVLDDELVLRGRSLQGRPGVHLLTPLRLEGSDRAVLVDRGWAPSPDAASIDPRSLAEPEAREVAGVLQLLPDVGGDERRVVLETDAGPVASVLRLDRSALQHHFGSTLLPVYLQQLPDQPAPPGLTRLPLPDLSDSGPHLGYALQWFSFAAIAVIGTLLLLFLPRRPTR